MGLTELGVGHPHRFAQEALQKDESADISVLPALASQDR